MTSGAVHVLRGRLMGIIPQKKRKGKRKLCNISVHFRGNWQNCDLALGDGDLERVSGDQGTPEHQVCGGVLHQRGDRAAQRAGAVLPVPAAAGQQFNRTLLRRQRDAQLRQASPRLVQQLPGDGDQGSVVQWVEDKGGVQTVEELRGKGLPCVGQHLPLQGGPVPLRAGGEAQAGSPHEALGTQVGGHDQHGVAEIRFAAPAVGKHPSSITWSRMDQISRWAFSSSSSSTTDQGERRTASVSCPPSSWPT